jgi:pimeloyl-ACP methyl ester carboxylesterase
MQRLAKILLVITALSGLVLFVVGLVLWTRPLLVMSALARWELEQAGLEEVRAEGPRGEVVYFRGGSSDGGGTPVVLVHGLGHEAGTWGAVATGLAGDHRLLVPDLPGHGESGPEDGPLSLADEVEGLATVLDREAGETPVVLVGNSMGGWVSLLYALEHPERVERLVLVSTAGYYTDLQGVSLTPTSREEAREMVAAVMGKQAAAQTPGFILDDVVDQVPGSAAPRLFDSFREADLLDSERLGRITVPVDLVWGDRDGLLPLTVARRFEADLPRARLHVLKGCAHAPQRACPEEFTEMLSTILAGDPPPPRTPPSSGSPPPPPGPAAAPPPAGAG